MVMFDVEKPVILSRSAGLRPLSGRSISLCSSTTCAMEFSLVSTCAALAFTCTLSVTAPISIRTLMERLLATSS